MTHKILVVDDEKLIRWSLKERLQKEGYNVFDAVDGASAMVMFEHEEIDLVLLDMRLPDTDGNTVLKRMHGIEPEMPVIIVTAFSTVETAVDAMKLGAYDYIVKPFNMDELVITVRRALETTTLKRDISNIVRERKDTFGLSNLIGKSKKMQEIFDLVRKIAKSEATTILLRGESGTGKDVVARAIHYESNRANKPFMTITCTALQETLLESELFGHEKGSFTDAKSQKKGLFELAHLGTVFLDEIGDMAPTLQAKLLRALEEKAFKRIGGTVDIKVDVRVIATTNRDLEKAIDEGNFREDLYYRLNVIQIYIPPLRERIEDVSLLADFFIRHFNTEFRRNVAPPDEQIAKKLMQYEWPGNVRELRNTIERSMLLSSSDRITEDDIILGRQVINTPSQRPIFQLPPNGVVIEELERNLVEQALHRTSGNQTKAAELLGITRDQLRYRMEKFKLMKTE
ncbi:MAG: Fis family transcriptional regulator [Planctomycetes bacterium RBG_16_59_8]|nr:MAG: Fis family transcriptional regulator [Planctomycetes bacterium RBG_16_59_8]